MVYPSGMVTELSTEFFSLGGWQAILSRTGEIAQFDVVAQLKIIGFADVRFHTNGGSRLRKPAQAGEGLRTAGIQNHCVRLLCHALEFAGAVVVHEQSVVLRPAGRACIGFQRADARRRQFCGLSKRERAAGARRGRQCTGYGIGRADPERN